VTDGLDIDARIRDRLEALRRTLNDPGLSDTMKAEELACAARRVAWLEGQRSWADPLNDALAGLAGSIGEHRKGLKAEMDRLDAR
jgi:hypothetical protein